MNNQFHCHDLAYSDHLRQIFGMDMLQITVIEIIGPIGLFFCIINILLILLVKALKEPPSDILMFINILTILKLIIYYLTISILYTIKVYDKFNPVDQPPPSSFNLFCNIIGCLDIFSELCKFIITVIFCVYYISKVKNPLKAWTNEHKEVYILSLFIIVIIICAFYFTNSIGISIYGYCSIKFTGYQQYFTLSFSIGYMMCLLISSGIFLKYLKRVSKDELTFRKYFRYYFKFLIIFTINQLIIIISHSIIAYACSMNRYKNYFDIFQLIAKIAIVINPIFIFIIIINHPRFKKVLLIKVVRVIARKWELWMQEYRRRTSSGSIEEGFTFSINRDTILIELNNLDNVDSGFISQLKNKNRACILATILGCLCVQQLENQNMQLRGSVNQNLYLSRLQQQLDQYQTLYSFNSTSRINVSQQIANYYLDIFLKKLPVVHIQFISYCPSIFLQIQRMNRFQEMMQNMLPTKNQKQIIKDSHNEGEGGRSGQFFFFNFNRSLILKTLSEKEKKIVLRKLQQFFIHFQTHQSSFIVKIYSCFTIVNNSTEETINFMLMGNILRSIKQKYILRVFDLKGSSHHRQVMKDHLSQDQVVENTLKDIDFAKLQQKIWIKQEDSNQVKNILMEDTNFLCLNGLIDYSFLVIKINIEELLKDPDDSENLKFIKYYRSVKQTHVGYVFGIIDYLETWNIKKKGEKWYKSLFTKSDTISSQDPKFYYQRFAKHVINAFLP